MSALRVLVAHNRYRFAGGEERAVELHAAALERAGIPHRELLRESRGVGRARAAAAMLGGGERPEGVAEAVRAFGATVVHAHNLHPLIGPRGLAAARAAGARVVLHLHNFRLFCAIGVAFRDGAPCFRCRGRRTLPGVALVCRGSVPEALVYGAALSLHQPTVIESVDRFVAPSAFARGQLARLGLPAERIDVVPHYLPDDGFAERSRAERGEYALFTGRLAPEKGAGTAIEAAKLAGVPLKVVGEGPIAAELRALAAGPGARVELLGRVVVAELGELRARAAMAVVPTVGTETFGFAALGAMGAGLPVVATRAGALPEVVGEERCVARADAGALAAAMRSLWEDPGRRRSEGEALLARARAQFSAERFAADLVALYDRLD